MRKRILVITNACFSNEDANGRTFLNIFYNEQFEDIAQFFVYGIPNNSLCKKYYQVSDQMALKSFLLRQATGGIKNIQPAVVLSSRRKKNTHTALKSLIREIVWKYGAWNSTQLEQWIDGFKPTHLFLSLADNAFLVDLARGISEKYKIPILAYSTEDYYFKDHYFATGEKSWCYSILQKKIKTSFKKCEPYIERAFFNTPLLADLYRSEFSFPCRYIFPKSKIDWVNADQTKEVPRVSYVGNLGIDRHKALMEIADSLHQIDRRLKLNVYGKIPDDVKDEFLANTSINYCGYVDYIKTIDLLHQSDLLVHAEYNNEYYNRTLRYAFSTKIADSVCSGTPFLIYGHHALAGVQFLKEQNCAFVVHEKENLVEALKCALLNQEARITVQKQALYVRNSYFCNKESMFDSIDREKENYFESTTSECCL